MVRKGQRSVRYVVGHAAHAEPARGAAAVRVVPELGELFKQMFMTSRMPPEMHYKTCDGLLALQRHTDPDLFRTACLTAVRFGKYNYHFVLQLVKSRCEGLRQQDPQCPPDHANIRGPEQFS